MKQELSQIAQTMKELGLAALSRVNNARIAQDKWTGILSVLQAAHAMEILAKARIAEEHPLLLFDTYPKPQRDRENRIVDGMTVEQLCEKGRTIEWSSMTEMLWLTADVRSIDLTAFQEFGKLRNMIQHFGIVPEGKQVSYLTTLSFIYGVIDPFINECWGLFAVDYCQDYQEEREDNSAYWGFIRRYLAGNEIAFKVSPTLAENRGLWWTALSVEGEDPSGQLGGAGADDGPIEVSRRYYESVEGQLRAYGAPAG